MCRKYADAKHLNHSSVNISVTICAVKPKTNEQKKEEKVKAMKKCTDERVGHRLGGMCVSERETGGENGSLINCSFYKVAETCQQCQ